MSTFTEIILNNYFIISVVKLKFKVSQMPLVNITADIPFRSIFLNKIFTNSIKFTDIFVLPLKFC